MTEFPPIRKLTVCKSATSAACNYKIFYNKKKEKNVSKNAKLKCIFNHNHNFSESNISIIYKDFCLDDNDDIWFIINIKTNISKKIFLASFETI